MLNGEPMRPRRRLLVLAVVVVGIAALATVAYGLKEATSPEATSVVVVTGAGLAGMANMWTRRRRVEEPAHSERAAGFKRDGDEEA